MSAPANVIPKIFCIMTPVTEYPIYSFNDQLSPSHLDANYPNPAYALLWIIIVLLFYFLNHSCDAFVYYVPNKEWASISFILLKWVPSKGKDFDSKSLPVGI